ncbi:molybdopterin-dependent oxidoreductase [Sneathiella marina]|uniref:Molybdopterin-dependent oxidoreductase n=1 Tax=Sneathiella marina TaxID=2950108 RepID=A0ABY4WCY7_9PROT|nr:molybdopterin-dependent oxidoreductase [Sneathiella marina]USG62501.1 molybdopterin-dependent oxidoreductase [Sneathiella marina]
MAKNTETKYSVCTICDAGCQLRSEAVDGKLERIMAHDNPMLARNICYKGVAAPDIHNHKDRLRVPLKRIGKRGEDKWQEISYDQAMDEIADRLKSVVDRYGAEALAVSTSGWNTQTTHSTDRRFMNLLGSPNWISGVALCAGNTAAVNRITYGWFPQPDYANTKCIVLFGHNPRKHSWTPIYNAINLARSRGAKVIVLDPRVSDQAEKADLHLGLRAGTDAAMCLGWLKVIIDEDLFDQSFVNEWCLGFDDLRKRVDEYPLERVEAITGVDRELIAEAARLYANSDGATIPWTPITDQQISSTSAIRLHSILRAITGNLDIKGGETLGGFNADYIPESEIGLHDALSSEQKAKQLGFYDHPAFTYRVAEILKDPTEKTWGYPYADIVMGCQMANPTHVFRAMATGDPYPVKALFTLGNNTLLSYPNQHQILEGLMNQDLIVAHEIFMTPTAMLADYVLPGDVFSERNHIGDSWSWANRLTLSQKIAEPPEQASSTFQFWTDLAHRMGFAEHFPWSSLDDMLDHRLSRSNRTFAEFEATSFMEIPAPVYQKYLQTGFATPSGKVELYSSILDDLGFDPLPYYREGPALCEKYPYAVFTGVREDSFFQTGQRNIPVLRERSPSPKLFLHPADATAENVVEGDWVKLETKIGTVKAKISIHNTMKVGHIRVPHGWWYPELKGVEELAGAFISSDAVLCSDDDEFLDYEQGIPHFKGFPGRITKINAPQNMSSMVLKG